MIYIKNYQTISSPEEPSPDGLQTELISLIDRTISVHTDNGGCVTGVLMEVLSDSIKLITKLPPVPRQTMRGCSSPGVNTYVSLQHITAIVYQSL